MVKLVHNVQKMEKFCFTHFVILHMNFHLQNFAWRGYCWDLPQMHDDFSTKTKSIIADYFLQKPFSYWLKALSCYATKYNAFYHLNCHMCTPFIVKCDGVVVSFGSPFLCVSLWLLCFCSNEFIIFVAALNPTITPNGAIKVQEVKTVDKENENYSIETVMSTPEYKHTKRVCVYIVPLRINVVSFSTLW